LGFLLQKIDAEAVVVVYREYVLAVVAPLRDVEGNATDHARLSRHEQVIFL
jgi:hypothetical protein